MYSSSRPKQSVNCHHLVDEAQNHVTFGESPLLRPREDVPVETQPAVTASARQAMPLRACHGVWRHERTRLR